MALTQQQIDDILELDRTAQVAVAAYWKITWDENDPNETRYYADIAYKQIAPFMDVGVTVEARLMDNIPEEVEFEINPDLRTDEIDITFDDIDKEIMGRFQTYGSGVRAELVFYFPDVQGWHEAWEGQLKAPKSFGWATLKTIITNGTRSRELKLPGSNHPVGHCRFTFGALLPTLAALASNGCPYDLDKGGTTGNLNPLTGLPYTDCPRDKEACIARLGGDSVEHPDFYGGFDDTIGAIVTDPDTGWQATSQSNVTNLKDPIIIVFGTQWVTPTKLLWRRDPNTDHPDTGWFDVVWEICHGRVLAVTNFKVNDSIIPASLLKLRLGTRGQAQTGYASDMPHYSMVAVAWSRIGQLNPMNYGPEDFNAKCQVVGLADVLSFNPTAAGSLETTGLLATYYASSTFTNEAGQRVLSNVAQPETIVAPISTLSLLQRFSLRIEGSITFEHSENYTMTVEHTGGAKLTINGSVIVNQLGTNGTHTGNFTPVAGTPYSFVFEFVRNASSFLFPAPWRYFLKWNSASQPIEVVPSEAFSISTPPTNGSSRVFTDDRVWALLECFTNYTWGRRYDPTTKFNIDSWNFTQRTLAQNVTHTFTNSDGDVRTFSGRRSTMNATLKGRPTDEQIIDICRAGRICVPFWHEGQFYLKPFRPASSSELANARVFTDTGPSQNIFWEDDQPSVNLSWILDDEVPNKIEVRFNDRTNFDNETPIFIDDKDQMLRAGRALGDDNLQEVPKQYSALGVGYRQEAVRLGRYILWFGEGNSGGIQNNLAGSFLTPYEQFLGLLRYDWIKLETELLDGFTIGTDNGEMDLVEVPEYFQVMKAFKRSKGMVEVFVQAYNHTAALAFETILTPPVVPGEPPGTPLPSPNPQEPPTTPIPPAPLPGPEPPSDPGPIVVVREPLPDNPVPQVFAYDTDTGYIEVEVTS